MKMKIKRGMAVLLTSAMVLGLAACGGNGGETTNSASGDSEKTEVRETTGTTQGVTDTEILVGNTAATTGSFATVGVPFNAGLEAALKEYNDNGGFDGKQVKFIHYDDGFDAAQGMTYTKTLTETDKVFAFVGHFGTNTVGATLDYIKEVGIPMVYAATGISALYAEAAEGKERAVFPVQPIYDTEGRVLLARAVAKAPVGLEAKKIGVISTTDDAGEGLLSGIKRQAEEGNFDITYQEVTADATDYTAAITVLKNAGCDTVIAACNQAPLAKVMNSMRDVGFNANVITSYVSASATTLGDMVISGAITADRQVYTTAWLDSTTEKGLADYNQFAEVMKAWEEANNVAEADTYVLNSYAMAGYLSGKMFIAGLDQLKASGSELTWENYYDAMEAAPIEIPMGGTLSYADGGRLGIAALALNTISLQPNADTGAYALESVSPIMTLEDVWAAQ